MALENKLKREKLKLTAGMRNFFVRSVNKPIISSKLRHESSFSRISIS